MKKSNLGNKDNKGSVVKSLGNNNNISEEVVEKEILKKMEMKNQHGRDEDKKEEIKYDNEIILSENEMVVEEIKNDFLENSNLNKKVNLYNEKFGVYQYHYLDEGNKQSSIPKKFNPTSQISRHLMDKEESLNNILETPLPPSKIDLNFSEFLHFRIFKYLDNHSDIYLNSGDLFLRQKIMNIYLFHILNHVLKRKEEIEIDNKIEKLIDRNMNKHEIKNILQEDLFVNEEEEFLKKYLAESQLKNFASGKGEYFEEYRALDKFKKKSTADMSFTEQDKDLIKDQGFTSPRVLILVPNKKHAKLIVEEMVSILRKGHWKGISNKKKFKEEFSEMESMGDCFRMGISFDFFNNKLRLYQAFDSSDIIIASPLGLKLSAPSASGNTNDPSVKNKKVYDFLSSIEILLLDFSEVFLYQNIDHLEEILTFLNKAPKNNQNIVNINRIKDSVVNNSLQFTRQNIVISHFKSLEIEMLVKRFCINLSNGIYYLTEKCGNFLDCIGKSENEDEEELKSDQVVKYEFKMLKTVDDSDIFDYKFTYFTKNIWQSLYDTFERHTIIFVSSTLDYIRLKSFFKKNSVSVSFISEDTDKKDWQRNRLFFEEGRFKFLLYSERAHFYKKINLKFAKNIFFYSLPEDPSIFKEMIELIQPAHYKNSLEKYKIEDKNLLSQNYSAVIALVTKLERYNLEKILGTSTCSYIFKNKLDNYVC